MISLTSLAARALLLHQTIAFSQQAFRFHLFSRPRVAFTTQHFPCDSLYAFPKRFNDDNHDGDEYFDDEDDDQDEDEEPSEFSMSPQEFISKIQPGKDGEIPSSIPSLTSSKSRSAPRLRQSLSPKKSADKDSIVYACVNCNAQYLQWRGRCATCQEWNTIEQFVSKKKSFFKLNDKIGRARPNMRRDVLQRGSSWLDNSDKYSRQYGGGPLRLTDVYKDIMPENGDDKSWGESYSKGSRETRTHIPDDPEINAVLGGGIMPGSITLVGGDPGVGKSTLLLQMAGSLATLAKRSLRYQGIGMGPPTPSESNNIQQSKQTGGPVLYVSGEENANQIASRALRLGIEDPELLLWCETDADVIADTVVDSMYGDEPLHNCEQENNNKLSLSNPPSLVIIDSIQTMICDSGGSSAAGGITQVRECVGLFLRLAKSTGIPVILVGHVTKSGDVAGPRTVEHMVDCVLYLEGSRDSNMASLRVLRAAKNRFGSSEEVGVYQMDSRQDGRLVPVSDPSSFFLATRQDSMDVEGCAISVELEGLRTMMVEIQALVSFSPTTGGYSGRRVVDGISTSRLLLILAVLQKRYGISFHRQDVYVNVVGGLQLGKGSNKGASSDLSVVIAVVSSLVGIPVRSDTAFVGEVGLLGELRPVHALEKRTSEARRMGFSRIITPSVKQSKGKKYNSPRELKSGGITQVLCENVLEAINSGLIKPLPTIKTLGGSKIKRARQKKQNSEAVDFDLDESLGFESSRPILDDQDDDYL